MTTTKRPRTEALKDAHGQPQWVGEGAQRQDGSLKLYRCTTCGAEVVWATSTRTGRPYLVNVSRGYHDQRFYAKRNAHRCEDVQAMHAEFAAAEAEREEGARAVAAMHAAKARYEAGEITREECLEIIRNPLGVEP